MGVDPPRSRFAVPLLAACGLSAVHTLRVFESGFSDDAFILFRYARHLADGRGLVWNVGEPPVEGFTSLLQVLLYAAADGLGVDLLQAGQALGIAFAVVSCAAAARLAWYVADGDARAALVAAFAMALSPPLAAWARGGMETTMFTALLALAMARWMGEVRRDGSRAGSSLLFFAATLARPEGFGIWALTFAVDAWPALRSRDPRMVARRLRAWWLYAALSLVYGAAKWAYFGSVLPETFHAKTGGGWWAVGHGAAYVLRFARDLGPVALLIALVPPLLAGSGRHRFPVYLGLCAVAYATEVALVGGDYGTYGRYLVPVLPMVCALMGAGAVTAWNATLGLAPQRRAACAAVVLLLAAAPWVLPSAREVRERPERVLRPLRLVDAERVDSGTLVQIARALARIVPEGQTVATTAVGAIGFYSGRPVLDLLGLNEPEIARTEIDRSRHARFIPGHMKGSARSVLERKPDFVLLSLIPSTTPRVPPPEETLRHFPFMRDLLESPEFQARYELDALALPDGRWISVYRRVQSITDSLRTSTK